MRRSSFPYQSDIQFRKRLTLVRFGLFLVHFSRFIVIFFTAAGWGLPGGFPGVTAPASTRRRLLFLSMGPIPGAPSLSPSNSRDRSSTMIHSAFPVPPRKTTTRKSITLADLLENPMFSNIVRLFIIVILTLGGYIWKTEMDHVNKALEDIKGSVNENVRRQWREVNQIKREVSQVNLEVGQILLRTNQMLFDILEARTANPSTVPRKDRSGTP